jgi:hypothetical protein
MQKLSALIMGLLIFAVIYGDEGVAGIDGYCYYVTPQGNVPACSVTIYCKRLNDGVIFVGNSKKYDPTYYVAQDPPGNDVYIPAGRDSNNQPYRYAVAGEKWNSTGPYAGLWRMNYTGSFEYPTSNYYCGSCHIYLRKVPGTEPQGGNE